MPFEALLLALLLPLLTLSLYWLRLRRRCFCLSSTVFSSHNQLRIDNSEHSFCYSVYVCSFYR